MKAAMTSTKALDLSVSVYETFMLRSMEGGHSDLSIYRFDSKRA
jgi:hypothetical protein